ncbi:MAG: family 10 glycosylhydrolase [Ignavibacteriaceae bacterium]|nr:family 10 glycosylhydrolase [Ignavibacteriaceae bacterium]
MKLKKFLLLLVITLSIQISAQSQNPKREFRGAWIAAVTNLDWPTQRTNPAAQIEDLKNLLDQLQAAGVNAVMFHIRTECDALYQSNYEPWSYWLTNSQGTPPNPFFDPLALAIEEAHKRGMELHAWFNPYRAERLIGGYTLAPNHPLVLNPSWGITAGTAKILDPGLPMVRTHILNVIMDVVSRYDVDGVHMDDYFYPYPPNQITNQDANTFATYPNGFTNIHDWRRNNINMLIAGISDSIQAVKPYVKFGMSPFGIWKNGVPPGISGLDAYSTIYCDAINWLQNRTVDYLTPQLYWPFGGGQDYGKLMPWWADSVHANNRHFYPGMATYRIPNWSNSEIHNQIRANRSNPKVQGSVFFRARDFISNFRGFVDSLKNNLWNTKAILPTMSWKDVVAPNAVRNPRFERIPGTGISQLTWDVPLPAPDGDTAKRYVVYRFTTGNIQPSDLNNPAGIVQVSSSRIANPPVPTNTGNSYYYVITALDRNYNESTISTVVQVAPPASPQLVSPASGSGSVTSAVTLKWNYLPGASNYRLQVSTNSNFSTLFLDVSNLTDTSYNVTGMAGETTYYWRLRASNPAGAGNFSASFSFSTGFPGAPSLLVPANAQTGVGIDSFLVWRANPLAATYDVQLSTSTNFDPGTLVIDATGVTDTTLSYSGLDYNRLYSWRVRAINPLGSGEWSVSNRFRTQLSPTGIDDDSDIPQEFGLFQNYPNPFNPVTSIKFSLIESGYTTLKVYDVLGREIAVLFDDYMNAGIYSATFDATELSSGTYLYELVSGNKRELKKMILVK